MRKIRRRVRAVALFLIVLMLAVPAYAATDLGLNVNGVTATTENQTSSTTSFHGDGAWTNVDGVLSGSATGKKGMFSSYTGTATLTFSIPKAGIFSFSYKDISLNSGSLTIDGTSVTAASTFSKEFTAAGTVTVVITSAKGASTTKATIYDIGFLTTSATDVTFKAVPGVDYTVNGVSVTEETGDQMVSVSTEAVSVTATYDDSTKIIREWKAEDGSAYSLEESGFTKPSESIVLTPVLGPRGTPQFTVNGARYYTWEEAFNGISNTTVTVTQSGTLPAGNYTVPAGVTLLIPFDTAGTCYTTTPEDNNNIAWETPTPYRTLTLASGAHLTINGAMSLSAKHHTGQALQNCGLTTGKYGHVDMSQNSTITVNSGGVLYTWGYITGSGSVTVKSGATCYEYFVMQDFKDGNSLSDLSGNKDKRVFMTNNYYVQNVVVPMTIEAGAYLNGYSSCFFQTLKISKHAPISFIVPGSENGMFKLSDGEIRKRYDYATDRMYIELDGTAEMGNISITASTGVFDITIDSVDYDLPIGSNITLTLKSGAAMNLSNQSMVMIPGSELFIEENASLNISSGQRFVLHDIDQWQKNYSYNARVHALAFVPNRTYTFKDSDLKDPLLMVNGTVDASGGYLYVTAGGGNTYSTNSGVVKFPAYSESTNSQYMRSGQSFDDYPITPAWLKNEDGSFVNHTADTAEDYSYNSEHGKWVLGEHIVTDTVTAPTCTAGGYTTHTCACGYSYTDTETDALGHTLTAHEAVAATCTTGGNSAYWACGTCGKFFSDANGTTEIKENAWTINAKGHTYGSATYNWTGYTACVATHSCTVDGCGHSETATATISNAVTTAATCTTPGVRTYTATFAETWATTQTTTENLGTDSTAHAWDNACDTTCNNDESHTREITHSWGEVTYTWSDNDTKCTASRECSVCHVTERETVDVNTSITEPTCASAGSTTSTATFGVSWAEAQTKEASIEATGCDWDEGTVTAQPTCTEKGVKTYTCSTCGTTKTEAVAALNHNTDGVIDHKDATCTEAGVVGGTYCTRCGEGKAAAEEAIAALGHDMVAVDGKDATCTEDGYTAHTDCSRCDHIEGKTVIPAGHTIQNGAAQTKTCTQDGWEAYEYCTECEYTTKVVIPAGHSYSEEWSSNDENHWHDCTVCGEDAEFGAHTYENGTCVCGAAEPSAPVAFVPTVGNGTTNGTADENGNVTFKAGTGTAAPEVTVTAPTDGWKTGENTFTVASANDIACVVIIKDVNGNYTRVIAETDAETGIHSFTATLDEGYEIIVAVKGDINGDGKLIGREVSQIKAEQLGNTDSFTDLQFLIADINGDGKLIGREVSQIKAAQLGNGQLAW